MAEPNRKLAAILSCDVVGYSRLMQADEAATVEALKKYRAAIGRVVERHKGRVVNAPGDSILAEFPSAVEAVQAAVEIQKSVEGRNMEVAPERRMQFRVGVNVGDVIEEDDGTIYGDGVNIAARMEALADAGGICISSAVYDAVEGKLDFGFDFLGAQQVKNIAKPVNVYRVRAEPRAAPPGQAKSGIGGRKVLIGVAAATVVIALVGVGVWQYGTPVTPPDSEPRTALALPDKPSIAVLPFANLSDDPDQVYFADGLTEDLITDLSKIPDLFVIARNSSFTYKDKPTKVQQVAADLGVQYVLEGSVRRTGDSVRINAQLIDAFEGHHLWAERYEGAVAGIFDFQDQVMGQIVANLAVELTGNEPRRTLEAETEVVEAYDTFLQGWDHYRRQTPEDSLEAIALFEKAIALDPNYGRVYAGLAAAYWDRVNLNWEHLHGTQWERALERALGYLEKALASPTTDAYRVSAEMLALRGRHEEALVEVERAIATEPNNPDAHVSKARVLNAVGRAEDAEKSARTAMRLDPHYRTEYLRVLGLSLFHQERYQEAAELIERVVSRQPDVADDYATLAAAYGHLDLMTEAQSAAQKADELFNKAVGRPVTVQEQGMFWWYGDIFDYDPAYRALLQEGLRKAGVLQGAGEPGRYDEYRARMSKSDGIYSVSGTTKIDSAQAKALHDRGVVFVDVRHPHSFRRGHIPGAANLELNTDLSEESLSAVVGKDDEVVFSCFGRHCPYSAYACAKAVTWGFTRVYHFDGGFPAWEDAGYPVEQSPDI